ncbi:MAG: hypothetical protein LBU42_01980 [Prevotellaceae bacterium]|nr:hypothetical protein [Prevotellaceae bacterium]
MQLLFKVTPTSQYVLNHPEGVKLTCRTCGNPPEGVKLTCRTCGNHPEGLQTTCRTCGNPPEGLKSTCRLRQQTLFIVRCSLNSSR